MRKKSERWLGLACCAVAAVLALSGCVASSSTKAQPPANADPWALPLEQRPPLWDPCTEIPPDALAAAGYGPQNAVTKNTVHKPGKLMGCDWSDSEAILGFTSSWRPRADFLADTIQVKVREIESNGLRFEMFHDTTEALSTSCHSVTYTIRGAIIISFVRLNIEHNFRGIRYSDPCEPAEGLVNKLSPLVPAGGSQ